MAPVVGIAFKAGQTRAPWLVVDRVALGVDATGARTRVDALEVATRHVTRAVGVDHALGPALRVGVAEVVPDALAVVGRGASALALGIEAAGRGRAGVVGDRGGRSHEDTAGEGVSREVVGTRAHRAVPGHVALGVDAARPDARVNALIARTCLVGRAVRVDRARVAARLVRVAYHVALAFAHHQTAHEGAVGVQPTRVGGARVCWLVRLRTG